MDRQYEEVAKKFRVITNGHYYAVQEKGWFRWKYVRTGSYPVSFVKFYSSLEEACERMHKEINEAIKWINRGKRFDTVVSCLNKKS